MMEEATRRRLSSAGSQEGVLFCTEKGLSIGPQSTPPQQHISSYKDNTYSNKDVPPNSVAPFGSSIPTHEPMRAKPIQTTVMSILRAASTALAYFRSPKGRAWECETEGYWERKRIKMKRL